MRRDMDLVRNILLEIEKHPYDGGWVEISIEGYSTEEITYHLLLLNEAKLVEVYDMSTFGGIDIKPTRLTWDGHEFLDSARDNNRWNKAKNAMSKAGGFVFEIGKQLLIESLKNELRQNQLL